MYFLSESREHCSQVSSNRTNCCYQSIYRTFLLGTFSYLGKFSEYHGEILFFFYWACDGEPLQLAEQYIHTYSKKLPWTNDFMSLVVSFVNATWTSISWKEETSNEESSPTDWHMAMSIISWLVSFVGKASPLWMVPPPDSWDAAGSKPVMWAMFLHGLSLLHVLPLGSPVASFDDWL